MTTPIVGVIVGATVDHLLVDVVLHETLCGNYIRGRIVAGVDGVNALNFWSQSTRQCSWCIKKLKKRLEAQDENDSLDTR